MKQQIIKFSEAPEILQYAVKELTKQPHYKLLEVQRISFEDGELDGDVNYLAMISFCDVNLITIEKKFWSDKSLFQNTMSIPNINRFFELIGE